MAQFLDQDVEGRFEALYDGSSSTTPTSVKAATASKTICILDITISTDTAQSVKLVDGSNGTVVARKFLAANGTWSKTYRAPKVLPQNSALQVTCGGSSGNVTVEVNGYLR